MLWPEHQSLSSTLWFPFLRLNRSHLLILAIVLHTSTVAGIYLLGRSQVAPTTFDTNGTGLSFAIDAHNYRVEAEQMATLIRQLRFREWKNYNSSFHVKLFSLSFAFLGPLVGNNILAAEPLNLAYYLSILMLTYAIAREAFDGAVALLAACVTGLWPSLLLHTTQMLRDPIFIASLLLLVLTFLLCINRSLSLRQAILVGGGGGFAVLLLWLCRGDMLELVSLISMIGAGICALAQLKERRFRSGSSLAAVLILVLTFWIPMMIPAYRQSNQKLMSTGNLTSGVAHSDSNSQKSDLKSSDHASFLWTKLAKRVGLLRHRFIHLYPLAGSNIDTDVELQTPVDIIRYLPRAAMVGFLAPFPYMWFTRGEQVGLTGRLISGVEMLMLYVILCLMAITLMRERDRLSMWLLFLTPLAGCTALGYVVVNVSSLYRMRYAFFILLVILGMKGLLLILPRTNMSS